MLPPPPISTLFPYTTLFRSPLHRARAPDDRQAGGSLPAPGIGLLGAERSRRAGPVSQNERSETAPPAEDRKSTRLNSSHVEISYAVFCLKKKNKNANRTEQR